MAVLLAFLEIVYPRLEKLSLQWLYGSAALTRLYLSELSDTSVSKKKSDEDKPNAWTARLDLLVLACSKGSHQIVWKKDYEKYWELIDVCCSALRGSAQILFSVNHIYISTSKSQEPRYMSVQQMATPAHLFLFSNLFFVHHLHITTLKSKTQDGLRHLFCSPLRIYVLRIWLEPFKLRPLPFMSVALSL